MLRRDHAGSGGGGVRRPRGARLTAHGTALRIGVDATAWANRRGFGRFARNLIRRLIALHPEIRWTLVVDAAAASELPDGAERVEVRLRGPAAGITAEARRTLGELGRLGRAVSGRRLDAFLFPCVDTWFPVVGVPTIVGLYDTIVEDQPALMLPARRARLLRRLKVAVARRRAARVFTVSESARAEIARRFGVPPAGIAVIPGAPDPVFAPRTADERARELAPLGLGAREPFLLYAGGVGPHKNLETLLEAYAALRAARGSVPPLVAFGPFRAPGLAEVTRPVHERIERFDLAAAVRLPGEVSDTALACLYGAAGAVVVPSLAEGFGLPAVEAAACGAPSVLSDIPAHRESMGDAALYFPPRDAASLAAQLARLLDEPGLGPALGWRARRVVARLSWDEAARRMRVVLGAVAERVAAPG